MGLLIRLASKVVKQEEQPSKTPGLEPPVDPSLDPSNALLHNEPPRPTSIHMCHSLDVWRLQANLSATHQRLLPFLNIANHSPHVGLITGAGFTAHSTAIGDGRGGQTRGAMTA